jgi:hypothetical protein
MSIVTYKNLFSLVDEQITKRIRYIDTDQYHTQATRTKVEPFLMTGTSTSDVSVASIVAAIFEILKEVIPSQILEGLEVEATTPESDSIIIRSGKGTAGGQVYQLLEDTTLIVPFNDYIRVFYVNLYRDRILVETYTGHDMLLIAKIVVPQPGITDRIINTRDGSWDAYIQSFHEYKLYGVNDKFEEDTIELLRDNIGEILADNIIGNIRLSENLKIINTAGTLELDSDKLLLKSLTGTTLAKFTQRGVYFNNSSGVEMAKFSIEGAHIGNIEILSNAIQSRNFVTGNSGFKITDTGEAEFNDIVVRGTIYADIGEIGGWTIAENELYATTTGTIKTSINAGEGYNGVVLDKEGIRVYDAILGLVVNFPSDGSEPTISAGTIGGVTFEINTNTVLRTSETVGDGSANSAGILINNTGVYGCEANQFLSEANFKVLASGDAYFKGTITATYGQIGSVVITPTALIGGLIQGSEIQSPIIETSATLPRVRIDSNGVYYQVTESIGQYNTFKYGDGTMYGTGVLAYLFNELYPCLTIISESSLADIRLYNRDNDPGSGTGPHEIGDLIVVDGVLKICSSAGSPGIFEAIAGTVTTLIDSDEDTKVEVERTVDCDIIYFKNAGTDSGYFSASGILTLTNIPVGPASDPTTDNQLTRKAYVDKYKYKTMIWYIPFDISTGTQASARLYMHTGGTITKARGYAETAPTGANIIIDINKNGSTIWSTQANRLNIVAGANYGSQTTFDTTTFAEDDYFDVDIDQVGSTVAGSDLTIELEYTVS